MYLSLASALYIMNINIFIYMINMYATSSAR